MENSEMWQVFLSHNSTDAEFARQLALDLESHGVRVWLAEWQMRIGDSFRERIQEGITGSGYLCIVLSPESVNSKWVKAELNAGLEREMQEKDVRVLPVLYRQCDIPAFLRERLYADFTSDYQKGLTALLRRLTTVAYGGLPDSGLRPLIGEDKVLGILERYSGPVGAGVSFFSEPDTAISSHAVQMRSFCALVRRANQVSNLCYASDRRAYAWVKQIKASTVYETHPGLIDICAPVIVKGEVLAAVFGGQMRIREVDSSIAKRLRELERLGHLKRDSLVSALREIPISEASHVSRVSELLCEAAKKISQLWSAAEKKQSFVPPRSRKKPPIQNKTANRGYVRDYRRRRR